MTCSVAVLLFPGIELLDFAAPYEVLTTANRVHRRLTRSHNDIFDVFSLATSHSLVNTRAGLQIQPDRTLHQHPQIDVLIVPGGDITQVEMNCYVINWIAQQARSASIVASICTGAFLLAQAGLLQGRTATTHWEDVPALKSKFPDINVTEGVRWVDEGAILTSGGIAAGIDMSLHLLRKISGNDLAQATARQLEYPLFESP
ncbi:MAG: DJ-1/PfpI family protein [Deltaproteobacteria bacterium]|nr:DJ-1/PfpI family protein [Deltaproteobacteria bacterium]